MSNSALGFILGSNLKNYFKELFHKPGKLILLIVMLFLLGMVFYSGTIVNDENTDGFRDIREVCAIVSALFILIFTVTFITGLEKGGSIFKMSDVSFLFPSPISKRSILFYGLIQQIGAVMFVGVFILFQYGTLSINYNLGIGPMLLIFLCYSMVVFFAQTVSMFVYTFVSDSDAKRRTAKYLLYALLIVLILTAAAGTLFKGGFGAQSLAAFGNSLALKLLPFAGWLGAFFGAIITGSYIEAALWLLLTVGAFTAIVIAMAKSKREYYEDVLDSATATYNAINAAKDGVQAEIVPKKVKLGKTGIGKGFGASVIYYKHQLENRRANVFMLSKMSLMFVAMTIAFSFFMRGGDNSLGMAAILGFSAYCGIFSLGTGRFAVELTKPFVYLIPEPPVKKLLYTLSDTLPAILIESLAIFIPSGIIIGATVPEIICAALAKSSLSIMFISGSFIIDRVWGGSLNKMVGILVYLIIDIVLAIPGIVCAAFVVGAVEGAMQLPLAFLAITVVNLPIALLVFFCCRNVLQYSEI